jgi:hypothetical protein
MPEALRRDPGRINHILRADDVGTTSVGIEAGAEKAGGATAIAPRMALWCLGRLNGVVAEFVELVDHDSPRVRGTFRRGRPRLLDGRGSTQRQPRWGISAGQALTGCPNSVETINQQSQFGLSSYAYVRVRPSPRNAVTCTDAHRCTNADPLRRTGNPRFGVHG